MNSSREEKCNWQIKFPRIDVEDTRNVEKSIINIKFNHDIWAAIKKRDEELAGRLWPQHLETILLAVENVINKDGGLK